MIIATLVHFLMQWGVILGNLGDVNFIDNNY